MTRLQTRLGSKGDAKPNALSTAALVCLLLLTLLAVAQVAHIHPVDTDADHCPLCIAMHSAAPVAVAAAVVVLVEVERAAPVYRRLSVSRQWHAQLFTRPPPEGLQG